VTISLANREMPVVYCDPGVRQRSLIPQTHGADGSEINHSITWRIGADLVDGHRQFRCVIEPGSNLKPEIYPRNLTFILPLRTSGRRLR
jgi:hypothetical protein